jgi:hypothetical protein
MTKSVKKHLFMIAIVVVALWALSRLGVIPEAPPLISN